MGICLYNLKIIQSRVQSACLSLKRTKPTSGNCLYVRGGQSWDSTQWALKKKKKKKKNKKRDYLQKIHTVRFNDQRTTISMASIKTFKL